ncbi:hypothetical protein U9M48_037165 [Paspalum notatum var. saurae]|uniref:Uncharacterized protein n=1 Tax=Paspalum notatum var. saurae TaxID=547442 RepID=A0AAQ3XC51_PASNO
MAVNASSAAPRPFPLGFPKLQQPLPCPPLLSLPSRSNAGHHRSKPTASPRRLPGGLVPATAISPRAVPRVPAASMNSAAVRMGMGMSPFLGTPRGAVSLVSARPRAVGIGGDGDGCLTIATASAVHCLRAAPAAPALFILVAPRARAAARLSHGHSALGHSSAAGMSPATSRPLQVPLACRRDCSPFAAPARAAAHGSHLVSSTAVGSGFWARTRHVRAEIAGDRDVSLAIAAPPALLPPGAASAWSSAPPPAPFYGLGTTTPTSSGRRAEESRCVLATSAPPTATALSSWRALPSRSRRTPSASSGKLRLLQFVGTTTTTPTSSGRRAEGRCVLATSRSPASALSSSRALPSRRTPSASSGEFPLLQFVSTTTTPTSSEPAATSSSPPLPRLWVVLSVRATSDPEAGISNKNTKRYLYFNLALFLGVKLYYALVEKIPFLQSVRLMVKKNKYLSVLVFVLSLLKPIYEAFKLARDFQKLVKDYKRELKSWLMKYILMNVDLTGLLRLPGLGVAIQHHVPSHCVLLRHHIEHAPRTGHVPLPHHCAVAVFQDTTSRAGISSNTTLASKSPPFLEQASRQGVLDGPELDDVRVRCADGRGARGGERIDEEGAGGGIPLPQRHGGADERVGEQGGVGGVRAAKVPGDGGGEDAAAGGDPAEERVGGDELGHSARVPVETLPEELRVELLHVAEAREAVRERG